MEEGEGPAPLQPQGMWRWVDGAAVLSDLSFPDGADQTRHATRALEPPPSHD